MGIFVLNCSFWVGTTLIVTFGCAFMYSFATVCQKLLPGSAVALCHHSIVTASERALATARPANNAPSPTTSTAAPTFHLRIGSLLLRRISGRCASPDP